MLTLSSPAEVPAPAGFMSVALSPLFPRAVEVYSELLAARERGDQERAERLDLAVEALCLAMAAEVR